MEAASPQPPIRTSAILAFWAPLAATWLMMAMEGPYLSAIVARLGHPVENLAAYGLAFSLAWLAESPIIMLLTASTALAKDGPSFRALRRFVGRLNGGVTALLVGISLPPVFRAVATVLGLPPDVARLAHWATLCLLPWPAAIGYRRFYQGVMVRHGQTRKVAYGTVVRLGAMSFTAAALALGTRLPGACIGALSLSAGVVAEAAASRWMARRIVAALRHDPTDAPEPSQMELARFYLPLALTSVLAMSVGPLLTFFMGHGANAVLCLAAWPVVQSFTFFFRSGGVAYQEVGVALTGDQGQHAPEVRRTATGLALLTTGLFALVLFTPLLELWFRGVLGLGPELLPFAVPAARLLLLLPALEYVLSVQRSRWVLQRQTAVITWATGLEIGVLAVGMGVLVPLLGWTGTLAAALMLTVGRLTACAWLASRGTPPR